MEEMTEGDGGTGEGEGQVERESESDRGVGLWRGAHANCSVLPWSLATPLPATTILWPGRSE